MTYREQDDGDPDELRTPTGTRSTPDPARDPEPVSTDVSDPHGAMDPISRDEYVGRRGGVRGLWGSLAYWFQLAALSIWGPAPQRKGADPIERLKRKYGRPGRRF